MESEIKSADENLSDLSNDDFALLLDVWMTEFGRVGDGVSVFVSEAADWLRAKGDSNGNQS